MFCRAAPTAVSRSRNVLTRLLQPADDAAAEHARAIGSVQVEERESESETVGGVRGTVDLALVTPLRNGERCVVEQPQERFVVVDHGCPKGVYSWVQVVDD
jgi:hypothetical protein